MAYSFVLLPPLSTRVSHERPIAFMGDGSKLILIIGFAFVPCADSLARFATHGTALVFYHCI